MFGVPPVVHAGIVHTRLSLDWSEKLASFSLKEVGVGIVCSLPKQWPGVCEGRPHVGPGVICAFLPTLSSQRCLSSQFSEPCKSTAFGTSPGCLSKEPGTTFTSFLYCQ